MKNSSSAAASLLALSLPLSPRPKPCYLDYLQGQKLKVFVYSLPTTYHSAIIEYIEGASQRVLNHNCAYLREPCPSSGFTAFENLRTHCTDVPLLYKLLQATSIVTDSAQADVFLVPFLMGCNAVIGWGSGLKRFNKQAHQKFFNNFPQFVAEHLPHFKRFPHRHLFLFPVDSMFTPRFLAKSMVTHTGSGYNSARRIDVPVPHLIIPPSGTIRTTLDDRPCFIFLMASSARNPIRRHVAWQLRQAQRNRDIAIFNKPGGAERCHLPNGSVEERAGCGYISFQETGSQGIHPLAVQELANAMRRSVFCLTPVGDGDGFTQRFWFSISAGCIPVRVDSYYPDVDFEGVAWPFKTTVDWRRAVVVISPKQLRLRGVIGTLRQLSAEKVEEMQRYIATIVKPATRIDFHGDGPDLFSAFLSELLYLSKYRLPQLDNATSQLEKNATTVSGGFAYSFSAHAPAKEGSRREGKNGRKGLAPRISK